MSWWESELSDFELVNVVTNVPYVVFGLLPGDAVFAVAMCWLAVGSALFHAHPTNFTQAVDHSGMYAAMAVLVVPYWGVAALFAAVGFVLPDKVLVPAMGTLFVLSAWGVWHAIPVFALAYVVWNVGRRRWDDDANPSTTPWYARYCHGVWHVLTAYGLYTVFLG